MSHPIYTFGKSRYESGYDVFLLGNESNPLVNFKGRYKAEKEVKRLNLFYRSNVSPKNKTRCRSVDYSDVRFMKVFAASRLCCRGGKMKYFHMKAKELGISSASVRRGVDNARESYLDDLGYRPDEYKIKPIISKKDIDGRFLLVYNEWVLLKRGEKMGFYEKLVEEMGLSKSTVIRGILKVHEGIEDNGLKVVK